MGAPLLAGFARSGDFRWNSSTREVDGAKKKTGGRKPPAFHLHSDLVRRIVAPLKRRTVIITLAVSRLVRRLVRRPPQARLVGIFLIQQLVLVLDGSQARLDLVEFRRGHDVLRLRGKNPTDLVLRLLDAILILRM